MNEMSTMMDCWKRTDFGPSSCASETAEFHKCMAVYEVGYLYHIIFKINVFNQSLNKKSSGVIMACLVCLVVR